MKDLPDLVQDIVEATKKHEQYRDKECINMIASEGLKSPAVNQMLDLSHDLACVTLKEKTTPKDMLRNGIIKGKNTCPKLKTSRPTS